MSTKVYGTSDDLIEFEGDFRGEVGCYGTDEEEKGVLVFLSDGTVLEVKYGKDDRGIWEVKVLVKGNLYESFEPCTDEEADIYSDIITLKEGIKWAYTAPVWEKVS